MPSEIALKILSHEMFLKFRGLNPLNSELLGAAELDSMSVSVREELPPDLKSSTVLHECIHIIEKMFQLELTETQVDCLAIGLYSLLKENPNLVELLLNHAKEHPVEELSRIHKEMKQEADKQWVKPVNQHHNVVPPGYVDPGVYKGKEPKT